MPKVPSLQTALALLLSGVAILGGCAQDVGDIDRTQPNLLPKTIFEGRWFVQQTVIDVPETSTFSFIGDTGDMEMIVWEIQEEYMVGYRGYEQIPGADPGADQEMTRIGRTVVAEGYGEGRNPDLYKGAPIVAYPVEHVDVIRDYNARTGEQTNVITENTSDRPWHERDYVRVSWNQPQVSHWFFKSDAESNAARASLVSYAQSTEVDAEGNLLPDAFRVCHSDDPNNCTDGRHTEADTANYFDFTERLFANPSLYGCILALGQTGTGDCAGQEVKIRTSFMKVNEVREDDYIPLVYDDNRQGEFGYFRTERISYDRRRGATNEGLIQLANRHDMWKNVHDAEGNVIVDAAGNPDYSKFGLRQVTYTLSPNYPEEMLRVTGEIQQEYDDVFKRIVETRTGKSRADIEAELMQEYGSSCMYCVATNDDGAARIGDLRYNFIHWVDHPQISSPLGYGPSAGHPETGRIITGNAHVYGASVDTYASMATDMIQLINGDLDDSDIVGEEFITAAVRDRLSPTDPRDMARFEAQELSHFHEDAFGEHQHERLNGIASGELELEEYHPGWEQARLDRVRGTEMEAMLINDEVLRSHGYDSFVADALSPGTLDEISPLNMMNNEALERRNMFERRAERNNLWLADFSDPSIVGLARRLQNETGADGQPLDRDGLWQRVREEIYKGVQLHEIGHTVGLRHSFAGSADPMNYYDEYWPLREETLNPNPTNRAELLEMNCTVITAGNQAACQKQLDESMAEYQYTSIMDYGARFNSDFRGLGRYDHAALAAAYGDLVEIFDPEVTQAMDAGDVELFRILGSFRNPLFSNYHDIIHYSALPDIFGGSANLSRRQWVPRETFNFEAEPADPTIPLRVPYLACYDEYVGSSATCQRWDQGADMFEISMNAINTYKDYYVINNFSRDRLGYSSFNTGARALSRYFAPLVNQYQHWVFDYRGANSPREVYQTMGMQAGFQHLASVVAMPRHGSYRNMPDGTIDWDGYTQGQSDLDILPGPFSRRLFTQYDVEGGGYSFFDRVVESGAFWEKYFALQALLSTNASVLGIGADAGADFLSYRLPYYLVFDDQMDQMFSSLIRQDYTEFAARRTPEGELVFPEYGTPAFVTGAAALPENVNRPEGRPVDYDMSFSEWYYPLLFGGALLDSNYDVGFSQRLQVSLVGSGEEITTTAGFEAVTLDDPGTGRIYVSYRPVGEAGTGWVAAAKIDEINAMMTGGASATAVANEIEDLEMYRAAYQYFGLSDI